MLTLGRVLDDVDDVAEINHRSQPPRGSARYPEARADVVAVFRQAGLRAASEMGASPEQMIEALPVETEHAA